MNNINIEKFKNICSFRQGIQMDVYKQLPLKKEGYIRFIRIIDYTQGNQEPRYVKYDNSFKNSTVINNDVTMVRYGAVGFIGRGIDGVIANNIFRVIPINNHLSKEYLYYYLNSDFFQSELTKGITSTTMPAISFSQIEGINILFPQSLQEQEKIAEILSTVDEAIEKTDALIEKYKKIKTGLMEDLFTKGIDVNTGKPHTKFKESELGRIPESWKVVKLGDVCDNIGYGVGASAIDYDGKHKYLRITDIDDDSRKFNSKSLVSPDFGIEDRYKLKENDIVFARTGASVGKTYIYNKNDGDLYCAGFLIKFSVTKANSIFVFNQTLRGYYKNWVHLMSLRSGQPGINAEEFKSLNIFLPPIEEQDIIAEILSKADKKIEKEEAYKEKLEKIKKGLMNDLLTGVVRVEY